MLMWWNVCRVVPYWLVKDTRACESQGKERWKGSSKRAEKWDRGAGEGRVCCRDESTSIKKERRESRNISKKCRDGVYSGWRKGSNARYVDCLTSVHFWTVIDFLFYSHQEIIYFLGNIEYLLQVRNDCTKPERPQVNRDMRCSVRCLAICVQPQPEMPEYLLQIENESKAF